jgi:hypothetical protein
MTVLDVYTDDMRTVSMDNATSQAQSNGRYRKRTELRGLLPRWLVWSAPKGRHDCGDHEWYRSDASVDRCYHCVVGVRQHETIDASASLVSELERSAAAGSKAANDALSSIR